jgi:hypothetical protein
MRPFGLGLILLLLLTSCGEDHSQSANVPLEQVPEAVIKVAKDKLPGVTFEQAWKTRKGNYEVRGKAKDGKVRDIQITPSGDVIEID